MKSLFTNVYKSYSFVYVCFKFCLLAYCTPFSNLSVLAWIRKFHYNISSVGLYHVSQEHVQCVLDHSTSSDNVGFSLGIFLLKIVKMPFEILIVSVDFNELHSSKGALFIMSVFLFHLCIIFILHVQARYCFLLNSDKNSYLVIKIITLNLEFCFKCE